VPKGGTVPNKLQNYEKELQAIMYALAESVAEASDEDILTETQEDGENPDDAAERVRNVLLGAVKDFRQRRLVEAQRQYELHIAAMERKKYNLPATTGERRNLLNLVLSRQPEMQSALLTAQYRDFKDLTDADVESYLKQLQELGALDNISNTEDEEK
jgi:hypothetical protein